MGRQPYRPQAPAASAGLRRDRLLLTGGWLLLCIVFLRAGFWQLDRASEKQVALDRFGAADDTGLLLQPINERCVDELRYRRLELSGRYAPERQILLDNMITDGKAGYQVLTPFLTDGQWVLVNRGWLPANPNREQLPTLVVDDGERRIVGRLNRLPEPGLRLAATVDDNADWPRRLLFPTRDTLASALELPLPDYQVLLNPDQPDGYRRNWQIEAMGPATHYGYALQWFSFAVLACIFYVVLLWRGRHVTPPSNPEITAHE